MPRTSDLLVSSDYLLIQKLLLATLSPIRVGLINGSYDRRAVLGKLRCATARLCCLPLAPRQTVPQQWARKRPSPFSVRCRKATVQILIPESGPSPLTERSPERSDTGSKDLRLESGRTGRGTPLNQTRFGSGLEAVDPIAPVLFGCIESEVGTFNQALMIGSVIWIP